MDNQVTLKVNSDKGIIKEYKAINICPECGKKLYRQTTFKCSVLGNDWKSVDKLYCINNCSIDFESLIINE